MRTPQSGHVYRPSVATKRSLGPAAAALVLCAAAASPAADVTSTWLGGDGDWSNPAQWANAPAGIVASPNENNLGLAYDAVVNSDNVRLDLDVTLERLTFAGLRGLGSITGEFDLTLRSGGNWLGGSMAGTGTTTNRGTLSIGGSGLGDPTLDGRTLDNAGLVNWVDGNLFIATNRAVINNLAGGTFEVFDPLELRTLTGGALRPIFNNSGTFNKRGTFRQTTVNAIFNNAGTVNALGGHLLLNVGGTHPGTFNIAPGATLSLGSANGSHVLSAGAKITGQGTLRMLGSGQDGLQVQGDIDVGTAEMSFGGLNRLSAGRTFKTSTLISRGASLELGGTPSQPSRLILNGDFLVPRSPRGTSIFGPGVVDLGGATRTFDVADDRNILTEVDITGATSVTNGGVLKTGSGVLVLRRADLTQGLTVRQGTVKLLGPNTMTGGIRVVAAGASVGTLEVDRVEAFGSAGNTLTLAGGRMVFPLGLNVQRPLTLGADGDGSGTIEVLGPELTFAGVAWGGSISGTGGLTKTGAGILTLTAVSSYTGQTRVDAGTLALPPGSAIGDHRSVFHVGPGGRLDLRRSAQNIGALFGSGTVDLSGSAAGTAGGTLTLGSKQDVAEFSGAISGAGTLVRTGASGVTTLSGPVSTTGGGVRVDAGRLMLRGNNTFTGPVRVNNAGSLSVGSDANLGDAANAVTLADGGRLRAAGTFTTAREVSLTGTGGSIEVDPDASLTFTGALRGDGRLTKAGGGTLSVTSQQPGFTGMLDVAPDGGDVSLSGAGTLVGVPGVRVGHGGTLSLDDTAGDLDRLSDGATLTLEGGTFHFAGASGGAGERLGNLASGAGSSAVELSGGGGELTFASLLMPARGEPGYGGIIDFGVVGAASLGGDWRVFLLDGVLPPRVTVEGGRARYLPTYGIVAGDFSPPSGMSSTPVPELSGSTLLATGFSMTALRRRRGRV